MDKLISDLGNVAANIIELKKARAKKTELEKMPEPERTFSLVQWRDEKLASIEEEKQATARSIVQAASQEISASFSEDGLKQAVWLRLSGLSLELKENLFSLVVQFMEEAISSYNREAWKKRFSDIDREINNREARLPKVFKMDFINTLRDESGQFIYPASRIGIADNKPFDKRLTDFLGSKKPIFFEPYKEWLDRLEEFYEKVYLVEYAREREAAQPVVEAKPEPTPVLRPDEIPSTVLYNEFYKLGEERQGASDGNLRRNSRIYKGGGNQ